MKTHTTAPRLARVAFVTASLLCACSGGGVAPGGVTSSTAATSTMRAARTAPHATWFAQPDAKSALIYVADYSSSAVHIFPEAGKNQQQIGLITNVPVVEYLNVDRWHNLYVDEFSAGQILVFPRGATSPSLTLTVQPTGAHPNSVAISRAGEVAVGQFAAHGIEFYHKGDTTPYNTVAPPAGFGNPASARTMLPAICT